MRQLLMTVMLIVTVVLLYTGIAQGNGGTKDQVRANGERMAERLSGISP